MADKIIINLTTDPRPRGHAAAAAIRATRMRVGTAILRPARRSTFHAQTLRPGLPALKLLMGAGVVSAADEARNPMSFAEVSTACGEALEPTEAELAAKADAEQKAADDAKAKADADALAKAEADVAAEKAEAERKAEADAKEAADAAAKAEAEEAALAAEAEAKAFAQAAAPVEQPDSEGDAPQTASKKSKKKGK